MRNLILSLILVASTTGAIAQLQPMLNIPKQSGDKLRGESDDGLNYGFLPFRGKSQLCDVYNGREGNVSNALKELQYTSISLSVDTINSNSIYVELLSFIPAASIGRFSFGSQLSQSDIPKDTNKIIQEDALQNVARQKLMNGGGSFSLSLSRPLLFLPFSQSSRNYLITNASATCYADIEKLNSTIYNPGLGTQLNLDFDLRIFSNKSEVMIGNFFRMGIRGRIMYNAFDAKYRTKNNLDYNVNNLAIYSISAYLGIGPIFIEFGTSSSNKSMYSGAKNLLRFSLQPVKF